MTGGNAACVAGWDIETISHANSVTAAVGITWEQSS